MPWAWGVDEGVTGHPDIRSIKAPASMSAIPHSEVMLAPSISCHLGVLPFVFAFVRAFLGRSRLHAGTAPRQRTLTVFRTVTKDHVVMSRVAPMPHVRASGLVMAADASASLLLDLPVELLEKVVKECTIATLAQLSAACTQLHALARANSFRILAADPSVRCLNESFRRTRELVDDGLPGHSPIESLVLHRAMYNECLRNPALGSGAFVDNVLAAQLKSVLSASKRCMHYVWR
jgi:hypothetical protein